MPSVIPYDPSLVLGNIVSPKKLEHIQKISQIQAPADRAEDELNSLISLRRSMDMTIQEVANLGINTQQIAEECKEISKEIEKAAVDYAKIKIAAKKEIQKMYATPIISTNWESPLDYNRTDIKKMPLSADSLNLNVQYFSFDSNSQSSNTQAQSVQNFVSSEFRYLGNSISDSASKAAQSQIHSQYSRHKMQGTLVISASCTHKDALLLAPCIIDVDKGIRVWNSMYPNDKIKTNDYASLTQIANEAQTEEEASMNILSGATYGSCFVGMVHILNESTTISTEKMYSLAESLQAQIKMKCWIADAAGGFGVSRSVSNDVKDLFSSQSISAHCTLTTRGSIPSIKSNQVKIAVKEFTSFDGKSAMDDLAKLQNSTSATKDSVDASAAAARKGQQMLAMQNTKVESVLSALGDLDEHNNSILDINSMMTAFEDYIDKALQGELGVPINFYLKPITKSQLAEMWVDKYFPKEFLKMSTGDDSAIVE